MDDDVPQLKLFSMHKSQIAKAISNAKPGLRTVWMGLASKINCKLSGEIAILESRPAIRIVDFGSFETIPFGKFPRGKFQLAFPYVQYFVHDNGCWDTNNFHQNGLLFLSFRNSPLPEFLGLNKMSKETIWFPPIPNVYDDHCVCLGSRDVVERKGNVSMDEFSKKVVKRFWLSSFFNINGWPSQILIKDTSFRSFDNWKEMTKNFGLSVLSEVRWPGKQKITNIFSCLQEPKKWQRPSY